MEYWKGDMNWPVDENWRCPTCGEKPWFLQWGFVNGECRCTRCHTQFMMKDGDGKAVTTPICQLKEEYKEPAKIAYKRYGKPVDMITDEQWSAAFESMVSE